MITSIVIIVVSVALFLYWFRYSCLLILESRFEEDEARPFASPEASAFALLEQRLAAASTPSELKHVRNTLDDDLRLIPSLTRDRQGDLSGIGSLESRLLLIDDRLMQFAFFCFQSFGVPKAPSALREMSRIIGYLATESGVNLAAARG
jgi:hypothetical protein